MDKVQHFEIPVDDMNRAKEFYNQCFGWRIEDYPMQGMEYAGIYTTEVDNNHMPKEIGAINGGMMKRTSVAKHPSVAITVDDIDETLDKVKSAGGQLAGEKIEIPGMGHYAYIKDTEGNVIGIWESIKKG